MASTTPASAMSATTLIRGKALNHTIASQHTSIHREVSAHHERPHSRILLSQPIGLVCQVRLVFPTIDEDQACEARGAPVRLVQGITPTSATA